MRNEHTAERLCEVTNASAANERQEVVQMAHQGLIAQCPYFAKENQTTIFCEGDLEFFENAEEYHAQVFRNGAEKAAFKRAHCGRYPDMRCGYADYLNKKYGGK